MRRGQAQTRFLDCQVKAGIRFTSVIGGVRMIPGRARPCVAFLRAGRPAGAIPGLLELLTNANLCLRKVRGACAVFSRPRIRRTGTI